ncbi:MAG TPA: MATE family efflux transporter, partial [Microbacteriaceae bacterium]|nr:MATE family efflux transporter [Microbacteriaceae bacterium]
GHLGAIPLAGLAIASAILTTVIGLMIFLAYSTTPLVARRRGAGNLREAVQAGIDGIWLALALGAVVATLMWVLRKPLIAGFRADFEVANQAEIYLGISTLGVPAMLIVFAAMGLLRGLQDTLTPLYVATIGFTVNALLNWFFIYGLGWGIAGSAWGTVIAQWGMVLVYVVVVARHALKHGAGFLPESRGLKESGRSGSWLFIRTLGLRLALIFTVAAAAAHGAAATAGYQIVFILVSITAFGLDALAVAAQALVGDALGARDAGRARLVLNRTLFWGVVTGVLVGLVVALLSPWIGRIFTSDESVLVLLPPAIVVVGITLPLGAVVYVLDGVLMGAGDSKYLAIVSVLALIIYLPVLWIVTQAIPTGAVALAAIALAFTLFLMLLRAITLWVRVRGDKWLVLGWAAK